MAGEPRKHHYVPKFHLAKFTASATEDGQLHVTDKVQRRPWVSTPIKTARETDFYRVDLENLDPMGIEKGFAQVEGKCATAIREVIESKRLPTGETFGVLLNFVAISATRVPPIRKRISGFIDETIKQLGRLAFLGPDGAKRLRESPGNEDMTDEEIAELQAFIADNDYTIDLDQNWHIDTMLKAGDRLLPALAQRHWGLWIVDDGAPDLVCSDNPVAFWATTPMPPLFSLGFGTPNTLMSLPLDRRILLVSKLEATPDNYVMDRDDVACMNTLRATGAVQVYSSGDDWVWIGDGVVSGSQAYLDSLS